MSRLSRKDKFYDPDNSSFLHLLFRFGIRHIIISWDTLIASISLIFIIILRLMYFTSICEYARMIDKVVYIYITVGATLFAIVLASLAVMTALTNGKLIGLLLKDKTLHDLLFPFWFVATGWGITILVGIILYIFVQNVELFILPIDLLFPFSTFLFVFSLVSSVSLTGHTIRIITEVARYFEDNS